MSSAAEQAPAVPSAAQCRGARGLLGWTQKELAERTGLSRSAINEFEQNLRTPHPTTVATLRACFEGAGIRFRVDPDGVWIGRPHLG